MLTWGGAAPALADGTAPAQMDEAPQLWQASAHAWNEGNGQYGPAINLVMLNMDEPQWQGPVRVIDVTGVSHLVLRDGAGAIAQNLWGQSAQISGPSGGDMTDAAILAIAAALTLHCTINSPTD